MIGFQGRWRPRKPKGGLSAAEAEQKGPGRWWEGKGGKEMGERNE